MNTTSDESVEFDDDFAEDEEPIAGGPTAVERGVGAALVLSSPQVQTARPPGSSDGDRQQDVAARPALATSSP
jgi:hypothetical protein